VEDGFQEDQDLEVLEDQIRRKTGGTGNTPPVQVHHKEIQVVVHYRMELLFQVEEVEVVEQEVQVQHSSPTGDGAGGAWIRYQIQFQDQFSFLCRRRWRWRSVMILWTGGAGRWMEVVECSRSQRNYRGNTVNTGGGGGGGGGGPSGTGGAGGSGIVIIKELTKIASGVWSLQCQYNFKKQGTWTPSATFM
jgi:hypothetical protein